MASSLPLTFLRPMALPRPATLHKFLGAARISPATIRAESTTASIPTPAPQSTTATTAPPKPYRVTLTPSNKYPIYLMSKRGGNKKLTKVRRIEGDVTALKNDLQEALGMDGKDVTINQLTRQIIVKGHMKPQIQQFFKDIQQ